MNTSAVKDHRFNSFFPRIRMRRGLLFGVIILTALLAFEFFNYSTTVFALKDLMGDLDFLGIAVGYHPGHRILRYRFCWHCALIHSRSWLE